MRCAFGLRMEAVFALVDISQIFNTSPLVHNGLRMSPEQFVELRAQLAARDVALSNEPDDEKTLQDLRALYEPYTEVLSEYLLMPLPQWLPKTRVSDNWQTSAWEVRAPAADQPFHKCMTKAVRPHPKVHGALNKPQ